MKNKNGIVARHNDDKNDYKNDTKEEDIVNDEDYMDKDEDDEDDVNDDDDKVVRLASKNEKHSH
jgi:hypothetical protein